MSEEKKQILREESRKLIEKRRNKISEDGTVLREDSNENRIIYPLRTKLCCPIVTLQNKISRYTSADEFFLAVIPVREFMIFEHLMPLEGVINLYMKMFDLIAIKNPRKSFDYISIHIPSIIAPSICVKDEWINLEVYCRAYDNKDLAQEIEKFNPINHIHAQFSEMGCLQYLYFNKIGHRFNGSEVVISEKQLKGLCYSGFTGSEIIASNIDYSILINHEDDGKYIIEWTERDWFSVSRVRYAVSSDFDISQISREYIFSPDIEEIRKRGFR